MSTITLTETEQTDECSLKLTLTAGKTDQGPGNANGTQNTSKNDQHRAINKNSELKKSNKEPVKCLPKDRKPVIDKQFSIPEQDGQSKSDSDSEDDNNVVFENKFESLELNDTDKDPPATQCQESNAAKSLHLCCVQPVTDIGQVQVQCVRPKGNKNDKTASKIKGKGARIQPIPTAVKYIAVRRTDQKDIGTPGKTECDGNESFVSDATTNSSIQPSKINDFAATSMPPLSQGGMIDFIIIHSKADTDKTLDFQNHLQTDTGIYDLTVEMLNDIGLGESEMRTAARLHGNCRCILVFVTDNFNCDRYAKFLNDIALYKDLKKPEEDEAKNRVVPVLAPDCQHNDDILEVFSGLRYFDFFSKNAHRKRNYINSVKRLCENWRKKLP